MKTKNFIFKIKILLPLTLLSFIFAIIGKVEMAKAASTGSLNFRGIVSYVNTITVTENANATSLNLAKAVSNVRIGTVNEKSSLKNGYKVTVSSNNNGQLKGVSGNLDTIPYTIKYGGVLANLSNSLANPVVVTLATAKTGKNGVNKAVTITYSKPGFINADAYTDILVFTIYPNE